MTLVQQPPGSRLCGHAIIAMLARTTTGRVAANLGHERPTTWRELYSILHLFGIICDPKLQPCFDLVDLPPVAVVVVPSGSPVVGHWVLKYGDQIYNPACSEPYPAADLPFALKPSSDVVKFAAVRNVAVQESTHDGA